MPCATPRAAIVPSSSLHMREGCLEHEQLDVTLCTAAWRPPQPTLQQHARKHPHPRRLGSSGNTTAMMKQPPVPMMRRTRIVLATPACACEEVVA